jgi:hypothetical protein
MASILKVDTIQDQSGNNIINESADTITIGASGDTITVPTGATLDLSNATQTGVGGTNTPAFLAYASATTSMPNQTSTKITFGNEIYDTDSAFASSTFTVPSGQAGKYFFYGSNRQGGAVSNRFIIQIKLNTSTVISEMELSGGVSGAMTAVASTTINLSEGDTVEIYGYQDQGTTQTNTSGYSTQFTGFKIIE